MTPFNIKIKKNTLLKLATTYCFAMLFLACASPFLQVKDTSLIFWDEFREEKSYIPPGESPIEISLQEVHYTFKSENEYTAFKSYEYKILSQNNLDKWLKIEKEFNDDFMSLKLLSATTQNTSGKKTILNLHEIVKYEKIDSFNNKSRMIIEFPQQETDSQISFSIQENVSKNNFNPSILIKYDFEEKNTFVKKSRLIIDLPKSIVQNADIRAKDYFFEKKQRRNRTILTFEKNNVRPAIHTESHLPENIIKIPHILFSTASDWKKLVQAYLQYKKEVNSKNRCSYYSIIPPIAQDSTNKKIEALVANIQKEITFIKFNPDSDTVFPRPPCQVLNEKKGTSIDIANLILEILNTQGIKANLALIKSDSENDISPHTPGLSMFNHALVYVDNNWIDPSLKFARVNELDSKDYSKNVLIMDKETIHLKKTPKDLAINNTYKETRTVFLAPNGLGSLLEESVFTGTFERIERNRTINNQNELEEGLKKYVKSAYKAEKFISGSSVEQSDLSKHFGYIIKAEKASVFQTDIEAAAAAMTPWTLFEHLPSELNPAHINPEELNLSRKTPMLISSPGQTEITYIINAPNGYEYENGIQNMNYQVGSFSFGVDYDLISETKIKVKFFLHYEKKELSINDYVNLRKTLYEFGQNIPFLAEFKNIAHKKIEEGQLKEAIAYLQRLIEKNPQAAHYYYWYANALHKAGFNDDAKIAVQTSLALDSKNKDAWLTLGWILEHDSFARRFGFNHDKEAALQAYNKALELDEEDMLATAAIAILLEHDQKGQRYSAQSNLLESINQYKKLLETNYNSTLYLNLLFALMHNRNFKEIIEYTENYTSDTNELSPLVIRTAAIAALHNPQSAILESNRLFQTKKILSTALKKASLYLTGLRMYSEASTLLMEASKDYQDKKNIKLAQMLSKTQRVNDLIDFSSSLEEPVKKLLFLYFEEIYDWKSLFAPEVRNLLTGNEFEEFKKLVRSRLIFSGEHYNNLVNKDMIFSLLQFESQGSDQTGYKITITNPLVNIPIEFWVIKKNNKYYLAGIEDFSFSGLTALENLKNNKLKTANEIINLALNSKSELNKRQISFKALNLIASNTSTAQHSIADIKKLHQTCLQEQDCEKIESLLLFSLARAEKFSSLGNTAKELLSQENRFHLAWPYFMLANWALNNIDLLYEETIYNYKKYPDYIQLEIALMDIFLKKGEIDEYLKMSNHLMNKNKLRPGDYNNLAWLTLFSYGDIKKGIEYSLESVKQETTPSRLHTLASLYAETGEIQKARLLLEQILDDRKNHEPSSEDWYLIGRIAEDLNLNNTATHAYCSVKKSNKTNIISSYSLAQKRLKQINVPNCSQFIKQ